MVPGPPTTLADMSVSDQAPTVEPSSDDGEASLSDIGRRRKSALDKGSASYQQRRREIAHAAAAIFNRRGFKGTSLTAVAKALGTDRASLYYYIANKRELFDEVIREVSEANVAMAESVLASGEPALEKLRRLVVELMRSYGRNYPLLYVYIREDLSHVEADRTEWSQYMRSVNRKYDDAIIAIVQEGIDDGTVRPIASARVLAFGVIGMINWTNRWFVPDRSPDTAEEIGGAYAELVVGGLRS